MIGPCAAKEREGPTPVSRSSAVGCPPMRIQLLFRSPRGRAVYRLPPTDNPSSRYSYPPYSWTTMHVLWGV
jgi:hypothetical protein